VAAADLEILNCAWIRDRALRRADGNGAWIEITYRSIECRDMFIYLPSKLIGPTVIKLEQCEYT
jgi:hypothetical protein